RPAPPRNTAATPPSAPSAAPPDRRDAALATIIPESPNKPYDMHKVITAVVDEGYFFEVQPGFGQNILCGFARLGGRSVGIVANQPPLPAGGLNTAAPVHA